MPDNIDMNPYYRGTQEIERMWQNCLGKAFIPVHAVCGCSLEDTGLSWRIQQLEDGCFTIQHSRRIDYFHALGMLHYLVSAGIPFPTGRFYVGSNPILHRGVLVDCSRNAVFTVAALKNVLCWMALCGMDELYLYMEDVYPIDGKPYFGYMRGRYRPEELVEIQSYAALFGIEVIPAIQTLAHLSTTLRWSYTETLRDTPDILLVGNSAVESFIKEMLDSLASLFTTRKIHIGMDEAESVGLGNYLKNLGYRKRIDLMTEHLALVERLCRDSGWHPMVWSDMFIRSYSPTGGYYDVITEGIGTEVKMVSDSTTLVYWDYYHIDPSFYRRYISLHQKLASDVAFAGGGWTWNGLAPNYSLAIACTDAAYAACAEYHVQRTICTIWFDNGAETPLVTALPMIAYHAMQARRFPDVFHFTGWFEACFGVQWDHFMILDSFDSVPDGTAHNATADNPSKWLLYQDPLMGLFDVHATGFDTFSHYSALYKRLDHIIGMNKGYLQLFTYYQALAKTLALKAGLGNLARSAYAKHDLTELQRIVEILIPECLEALQAVRTKRESLWSSEAKPFGFEVLDIRFAAVQARLETTKRRIQRYLDRQIDTIEEFEEPVLPFKERPVGSDRKYCACNNWREIVSAGTL